VVGVIVARFQVPELHEGHRDTIEQVLQRHETVLFVLGDAYDASDKDPLSFNMRVMMVRSAYAHVSNTLLFVASHSLTSSDERRSEILDTLIQESVPGRAVIIYGARDSIVHHYKGVHRRVELPTVTTNSATKIRNAISVVDSADFRAGVIYNAVNRKRIFYPTVDVAVVDTHTRRVLLVGWKADEGMLRFPGSFFHPDCDETFEDTGIRCIAKEIPTVTVGVPRYIASKKINDARYRKTKDGMITTLLCVQYTEGIPSVGRGIERVVWVDWWIDVIPEFVAPVHRPLAEIMRHRWEY
jgi:bifunctional NMN adenylyltransferase/nudix hydrolase